MCSGQAVTGLRQRGFYLNSRGPRTSESTDLSWFIFHGGFSRCSYVTGFAFCKRMLADGLYAS